MIRLLIVDAFYQAFLRAHYDANPRLADCPYEEQWRSLMGSFFGTADSYSHYLGRLGHHAHELVVNCGPLQSAWAAERQLRPLSRWRRRLLDEDDAARVVLAQAEEFRPDVVYVQNLSALAARTLRRLRRRSRLLCGQIASELPREAQLRHFDLLVTSFPHYLERFRALGIDAAYHRLAFDPRVLDQVNDRGARDGAVFVGALGRSQHSRGNQLLEQVARRVPLAFWGYLAESWPEEAAIRQGYRGEAWGLEMYRVFARAQLALNRHIDVACGYANNMRLFEATGMGALVLTEAAPNLADLFEPGREVVTYRDADELVRQVRHYLAHPEEAAVIGRAGQQRTLREHTWDVRMRELVPLLEARL